jgi:RimJ/RimL family protein N-acetyltransferase
MRMKTKRLELGPVAMDDKDDLVEILNNWQVSQWLIAPPFPYKQRDAIDWILKVRKEHEKLSPEHFGIYLRDQNKLIGAVSIDSKIKNGAWTLGYFLDQLYWGKGYVFEATEPLITYARDHLHATRIVATVDQDNLRSVTVLKKLGFKYEAAREGKYPTRRQGNLVDDYYIDL